MSTIFHVPKEEHDRLTKATIACVVSRKQLEDYLK